MVEDSVAASAAHSALHFEGNASVLAYFPDLVRTGISLVVHPADEMFRFLYYEHGADSDRTMVLDIAAAFPCDPVTGAGFRLRLELPRAWSPVSLLSVQVVTQPGEEALLYTDRIEAALLRSARLELLRREQYLKQLRPCEARLAETERLLADAQAQCATLEGQRAHLQAVIDWMQASRFWKLRNRWFALKRALRLTTEP